MAITLQHLIDDVRSIASSGSNPNEFRISDEQIAYWVGQVRAMLIGQSLAKRDDLNDTWLQTLTCLEMEIADPAECCSAPSGCKVLRSKLTIPATIDTWKANWVVSVTTADGTPIPKSNQFSNRYQKYNKYTGKSKYFYLKDNRIYVINNIMLDIVNVTALFQDPMDLGTYISCSSDACFSYDSEYPISANMASQVTDIIMKTKVAPLFQFPSDNRNDGQNKVDEKK